MLIRLMSVFVASVALAFAAPALAQGEAGAPSVAGMPAPAAAPASAPGVVGVPAPAPAGTAAAPTTPVRQPGFGADGMFIMIAGLLLVMILTSVFAGRKEKKRRAELLSSLHKGAKVQTSGGIIGVITELGDDEIVLRVEEGRVRFSKGAIVAVIKESRDKPANGDVEVKGERARSAASA